ncbi:MAG: SxtJ family membrane protein [Candidatus Omnitrophota bacterium]
MKKIREFGFVLALILCVIGTVNFFKGHDKISGWLFIFSTVSFVLSFFSPRVILPIYIVFTKIGHVLGWINTRIILSIIFYLVITPFGLVMKLFKKDPLEKSICKTKDSYWVKRNPAENDVNRYEQAF